MQNFPEAFLHYVWKLRLFDHQLLATTTGDSIEIIATGTHNHHAGPDFSDARVKIGATLWAGSVEMHKKSSDWLQHGHQHDKAYDNTILHVVYEHDQAILDPNGNPIPTLVLADKIPTHYQKKYWKLLYNDYWIPCQANIHQIATDHPIWSMWLDRLILERLEEKTTAIGVELKQTQNNWEETFYRLLARNFGVKQNTAPFEALAKALPLKILAKHKNNLFQLEALLLGQAGFLAETTTDSYVLDLQKEYTYLAKKYQLQPLLAASWKFGKMRPAAYPTIRLAQLAQLIYQSTHLFSKILVAQSPKELIQFFDIKLDGYWLTHYRLQEASPKRNKTLGKATKNLILINTVAPILFIYGQYKGEDQYKIKAFELLKNIAAEKNSIIDKWKDLGLQPQSALDTQALLYLKKNYCDHKKCLDCSIGNKIIQTK